MKKISELETSIQTLVEVSENEKALGKVMDVTSLASPVHCSVLAAELPVQGDHDMTVRLIEPKTSKRNNLVWQVI